MKRPWMEKYVGLPFINGGRDWQGVDCWGLVRLVLMHERGIIVPSYGEISAEELSKVAKEVAGESSKEPWHPTIQAQVFDVAVMHRRHAPVHVGIMANAIQVLHIERAINVVLIEVSHPSVLFRSIAYFRHRDLLDVAA
jgi:cell wall-associated NlpC family hydrolase